MLIQNAEVEGRAGLDVRCEDGVVREVGARLAARPDETRIDARGGALLPGLHDHHIHLLSFAASLDSLVCGPPGVASEEDLGRLLAEGAPTRGWLRGVGYHESVAGDLDRRRIDDWRDDVAVRIQHRSGAMWFLNSRALEQLGIDRDGGPTGVVRDGTGRATGALFRADEWLRTRLGPVEPPDLLRAGRWLAESGVTGLTDATPGNGPEQAAFFRAAQAAGELPQSLRLMGNDALDGHCEGPRLRLGERKILLDEPALPALEALVDTIRGAHRVGRAVAIHTVTRAEIHFAQAALEAAGPRPGDRLEHASVAPPEAVATARRLGLTIVTQPHFVAERGDAYRSDVEPRDLPHLYRLRGWLEAKVGLAAGTDAPFGAADPWRAMRAACERRTASGAPLGPEEAVAPERALALFTTDPERPGGPPRRILPGTPADLCLLRLPWSEARRALDRRLVRTTLCGGQPIPSAPD